MSCRRHAGFTLTEILITLAIVAVLAGIALPGYQSIVQKARRHDAEDALMGLRQAMERHFARTGSYDGAANEGGVPQNFPAQTPLEGAGHFYDLRVINVSELGYELTATPVGGQASDECGALRLNSAGQRGSGSTSGNCWNGNNAYPPP